MKESIKKRIDAVCRGEVPEGYCKDCCLMPIGWDSTELKKIAKKVSQKNKDGEDISVLSNSAVKGVILQREYFEKDIANDENTDGYFVVEPGDYIYNPRISVHAPFGPIKRNNLGHKGIVSPLYTVFRPESYEKIDEKYLEYFFLSTQWNRFVYTVSNQGVRFDRMNITDNDFFCMPIVLPPLAEQQKIAEILSTCDQVIELKQQLLDEKLRQKRCFMQRIFKTNGWEKKKLSELAEVDTGDADTQDSVSDGKYPFFVRSATIERIDSYSYDGEAILTPGDGKIGEIFHYYNGKFNYHQRVYKISDFHGCLGKYIYYYLQLFFKKRACLMTAKATVDSLRREMLTDMPIFLPPAAEQERIVCVLDSCEKEIELLEKTLECEKLKKKALMQLLLTGLVRVNA